MTYPSLHMLIGGEQVSGDARRTHTVVNPATGEPLGELPLADTADLDRALEVAARGFAMWRDAPAQQRAMVLQGAARLRFREPERVLALGPGDWADIRPHEAHRVDWTAPDVDTVWLAVFYRPE